MALLFSLPTLTGFRERLRQEGCAWQLASDLRRTQIEALALNETRFLSSNGKQFAFSKTGNSLPGGSGTVLIGRRKVVVSPAGRVRVE